jgi:hypothetical protein
MSTLSDLDHKRINAQVHGNRIIETHYLSDPSKGIRRRPYIKTWTVQRVIGSGAFGDVRLETCEDGTARAVKKLRSVDGSLEDKEYEKELLALVEFSKPKVTSINSALLF